MENKRGSIQKAYERILADQYIFDTLRQKLSEQSQLNEKFITKHILPLTQKFDPKITWQDILDYEKEALSQPTSLKLTDLENISGGKASNILLSCGLLALMGFAGASTAHMTSANFIPFTETKEYQDYTAYKTKGDAATKAEIKKYEYTELGAVPFYSQADHLVDGLLWFKHPVENKAFFVIDRSFNDKQEAIYAYDPSTGSSLGVDKPSFEDIKKLEFTLLDMKDIDKTLSEITYLTTDSSSEEEPSAPSKKKQKTNLKEYLNNSFNNANTVKFDSSQHKDSQTMKLINDNPLYNYSIFYNPNFDFTKDYAMGEAYNRNKLSNVIMHAPSYITSNSKYSKIFKNISFNKDINNDSKAKKIAEEAKKRMQSQNWTINHYSHSSDFTEMENAKTLNDLSDKEEEECFDGNSYLEEEEEEECFDGNSYPEEEEECFNGNSYPADEKVLRTLPFIFFTLVPNPNIDLPVVNHDSKTSKPFFNIPLVSCSIDLISISSAGGMCHCFNGSSEEVKEQIAIHYINKLFATYGLDKIKKLSPQEIVNNCNNMVQNDRLEIRIPTHISSGKWEEIYLLTTEDMSYVNFPDVEIIFKQKVAQQACKILTNTWLPPSEKILVANNYEKERATYLALKLVETFCNQLNSKQIEKFDEKK